MCCNQVEEGLCGIEIGSSEQVGIPFLIPERVVAIEISYPEHVSALGPCLIIVVCTEMCA